MKYTLGGPINAKLLREITLNSLVDPLRRELDLKIEREMQRMLDTGQFVLVKNLNLQLSESASFVDRTS
jgi:hypothetical protein